MVIVARRRWCHNLDQSQVALVASVSELELESVAHSVAANTSTAAGGNGCACDIGLISAADGDICSSCLGVGCKSFDSQQCCRQSSDQHQAVSLVAASAAVAVGAVDFCVCVGDARGFMKPP